MPRPALRLAGASFAYDANGNLTSDGTTSYLYEAENRLVSSSGCTMSQLKYEPLGRLYEVAGYNGAVQTSLTRFLHDGDELIAEYDGTGALLRRHVHGHAKGVDDPVVTYEGASTAAAARRYLSTDHQGSVIASLNHASGVVTINRYDPWGIPRTGNAGRFQYTGQAWLGELGLYHYKARMYSPTLGRFMQTDPIGYEDQINLYAYVANDPLNASDPSGLQSCRNIDVCPDIPPIQEDRAREVADGATSGRRGGTESGANSYINDSNGTRRIETGSDAGRGEQGQFTHTLETKKGERVEAIAHTHLDRGHGQMGLQARLGRVGNNGPSDVDQAAMDKIKAPVITVGPDVTTQLYREAGQDKIQVIEGNPAKIPNMNSQKIFICPGTEQC